MKKSVEKDIESGLAAGSAGEPSDMQMNMRVLSPEDLGMLRGAWEMLQNPKLLSIYAAHYGWEVLEHHGTLITVKRIPGLGILRAQAFSPESNQTAWTEQLGKLPAGSILIQSNQKQDLPVVSPTDTYSFIVDLRRDEDVILQQIQRRARKAIRKGAAAGFITREATDKQDIRRFHELAINITRNGTLYHVPPHSLLEALHQAGYGRLYLSYLDDKLVGGIFVLTDQYSHGLVSAYNTAATSGVPGTTMFWHSIMGEKQKGIPFFDFGAQSLNDQPQLTLFKRSFSPILVPAFSYELHPSHWRRLANSAWTLQRRLRRKP